MAPAPRRRFGPFVLAAVLAGTGAAVAKEPAGTSPSAPAAAKLGRPSATTMGELRRALQVETSAHDPATLTCATAAHANDPRCRDDLAKLRRPTTVVISGGVSLGSHQAGALYYLSRFLDSYRAEVGRHLGPTPPGDAGSVNLATGASAGSINAFLTAMASCLETEASPTDSVFYRTWIPVGMQGLLAAEQVTSQSVLSRAPIEDAICRVRGLWHEPAPNPCSRRNVDPIPARWSDSACAGRLAFNVTRLKARDIALGTGGATDLTVKRQTEKFLLEFRKSPGRDQAPIFRAYSPPATCDALPELYPILGTGRPNEPVALDDVFTLLKASSSFPIAFEPIAIPHSVPRADGTLDRASLDTTSRFIDGGIFDNTPLGIAQAMNACQRREAAPTPAAVDPYYVFIEPDARSWRPGHRTLLPPQQPTPATLFGIYAPFVEDFVTVSRQAELLGSIVQNPALRTTLQVPQRRLPTASGLMLNFLGFFERDFRRFDFYLGMVDAWDHLRRAAGDDATSYWQFALLEQTGRLPAIDDPMFECLRGLRRAEPDDFFRGSKPPLPADIPSCQRASAARTQYGNLLKLYQAVSALRVYSESESYDPSGEEAIFFAALERAGFRFEDTGRPGAPLRPDDARAVIRDRFQFLAHLLGRRQPSLFGQQAVAVVAKASANRLFGYRTPRNTLEVASALNGFGFGATYLLSTRIGFRGELGARVEPWRFTNFGPDTSDKAAAWIGSLALGWEIGGWNTFQPALSLGWQGRLIARNRDDWFTLYLAPEALALKRHGPLVQLRGTFFQRLTIGLGFETWLDDCQRNNHCAQAAAWTHPLESVTVERSRLSLFLGWRFLDLISP